MKSYTILLIVMMLFASMVLAENPPSLTSFEQFYGQVMGLPAGSFTLRAKVGINVVGTTAIANGKYGYAPTFKITARNNETITFVVVSSLGVETGVGTAVYQEGAATVLNFGLTSVTPSQNVSPNQPSSPSSTGTSTSRSSSRGSTPSGNFPTPAAGTCLYNWECSSYSTCQNGEQTRTCRRVDNCDTLKTQGKVKDVIVLAKPLETQTCSSGTTVAAPVAKICQSGFKRCNGQQVEQCSLQGDSWQFQQLCPGRCDPLTFTCVEAPTVPTTTTATSKPLSSAPYFIGGIVLLVVVIGGLVFLLYNRQKYGPIKKYIEESRGHGYSDALIRSRLMNEGWEGDEINRFLR